MRGVWDVSCVCDVFDVRCVMYVCVCDAWPVICDVSWLLCDVRCICAFDFGCGVCGV